MTQAVVSLCDSNYFPGLLALHASIVSSGPYEVLCYDAGLLPEQRAQADTIPGLRVLDVPDHPLVREIQSASTGDAPLAKPGKRSWPLWICPLLIAAAPARDVIWLDCDLLVLRGLDELFDLLEQGPVFTPESLAPEATPNDAILYEHLPIDRHFDPTVPVVNGGVSAWRLDRDGAALAAYLLPVREACRNVAVREALSWHDQGALIWAIQSLGLEDRVLTTSRWNLSVERAGLSADLLRWDADLLPRLRSHLPDVGIVHWNGRPPPWLTTPPA